jgi:glyoxylase-like metal-dependent hydrolase (beta-lactamase superfamily II)
MWAAARRGCSTWSQAHPLYRHREVAQGVWWITEKYFKSSWNLANIYFVCGAEADLLVDTGVGIHQLPPFLSSCGLRPDPAKPLSVVLTHMHFDHSGGAHQFPEVHAHRLEAAWVAKGDAKMCASWVTPQEVIR